MEREEWRRGEALDPKRPNQGRDGDVEPSWLSVLLRSAPCHW